MNQQWIVSTPGACGEGSPTFVADHPVLEGTQGCKDECTVAVLID